MTDPKKQTNTDTTAELPPANNPASATEALRDKLIDAQTPSYQTELDLEEAEHAGAFVKGALSEQAAAKSGDDQSSLTIDTTPRRIDPSRLAHIRITRANAWSLYGWKPGETLEEARARKKAERASAFVQAVAESGDELPPPWPRTTTRP